MPHCTRRQLIVSEQGEYLKQIDDIEAAHYVANYMNLCMSPAMEIQEYIRSIGDKPEETNHYVRSDSASSLGIREDLEHFEFDQYGIKTSANIDSLMESVDSQIKNIYQPKIEVRPIMHKYIKDHFEEVNFERNYAELRKRRGFPIPNEVVADWGVEAIKFLVSKAIDISKGKEKEHYKYEAMMKERQERQEKEARQAQITYEQVCSLEEQLKGWLPFTTGALTPESESVVLRDYKKDLVAERHHLGTLVEIMDVLGLDNALLANISDEQRIEIMKKLNSIYASGHSRANDTDRCHPLKKHVFIY